MVSKNIHVEIRNLAGIEFVAEQLGLGIKCCEVALSSASTRTWENKIKTAQKAHDMAQRFVHRFGISGHEARRISHRIVHLKTLLEQLK
jgi:hypothetical protein